jgi:signal transduction histidine kinase
MDTDARIRQRYADETAALVARRGPLCALLFVVGVGVSGILEYHYHPERLPYLLLFSGLEFVICGLLVACAWGERLRRFAVVATQAACAGLILCVTLYFTLTGASGAALVFVFIAFVLSTALVLPWGVRNQTPIGIVFFVLYALYVATGQATLDGTLPVAYGLSAVALGAGLSVLGAAILDGQRFTVFAQHEQLNRQLTIFRDLTETFHGFDPQRVLLQTCESTLRALPVSRLWAVWRAPGTDEVQGYLARRHGEDVTMESLGDPQRLWATLDPSGQSTEARVIGASEPIVPAGLRTAGVSSVLFVPFRFENESLGALWADRDGEPLELGDRERGLASVLASGAAIAIANARLYQRVTAASEEKSTFLARIAHELRNPVHTLLWDIDTLRKGGNGEQPVMARLRQNALKTLEQAKELQEFAEVETKRLTVNLEPVSLHQVFDDVRATAMALLDRRPITFEAQIEDGAEKVVTDPFRLHQILGNLLSNAAKFTVRGGIAFTAHRVASEVVISVRDSGVGIDETELATVFAPFSRGSAKGIAPTRGMGLGLAIAHELTSRLHGRIEVDSTVGVGSTFRLLLPVGDVSVLSATEDSSAPRDAGSGEGRPALETAI